MRQNLTGRFRASPRGSNSIKIGPAEQQRVSRPGGFGSLALNLAEARRGRGELSKLARGKSFDGLERQRRRVRTRRARRALALREFTGSQPRRCAECRSCPGRPKLRFAATMAPPVHLQCVREEFPRWRESASRIPHKSAITLERQYGMSVHSTWMSRPSICHKATSAGRPEKPPETGDKTRSAHPHRDHATQPRGLN